MSVTSVQAIELAGWLAQDNPPGLLDVREPWEVHLAPMPGAVHIPMGEITRRYKELDSALPWVCVCHHGMRSMQVAMFLQQRGFGDVINLTGGIDAYARQVDPSIAQY
jgi:rhodanese-related sulfurtransferase